MYERNTIQFVLETFAGSEHLWLVNHSTGIAEWVNTKELLTVQDIEYYLRMRVTRIYISMSDWFYIHFKEVHPRTEFRTEFAKPRDGLEIDAKIKDMNEEFLRKKYGSTITTNVKGEYCYKKGFV